MHALRFSHFCDRVVRTGRPRSGCRSSIQLCFWIVACSQHSSDTPTMSRGLQLQELLNHISGVERAYQSLHSMCVQKHCAMVQQQALALLADEFPNATSRDLSNKWKSTSSKGVFQGSKLVHVIVSAIDVRAANVRVLGICKGILIAFAGEIFVEHVLVAEPDRGRKILAHIMQKLICVCEETTGGKIKRLRLQCVPKKLVGGSQIDMKEKVYEPLGISNDWREKKHGPWAGVAPSKGYIMLYGTRNNVMDATRSLVKKWPLDIGVQLTAHPGGLAMGPKLVSEKRRATT